MRYEDVPNGQKTCPFSCSGICSKQSQSGLETLANTTHQGRRKLSDGSVNPIFMDCGEIITRYHGIMEQPGLLAFGGRPLKQQMGRFGHPAEIGTDFSVVLF